MKRILYLLFFLIFILEGGVIRRTESSIYESSYRSKIQKSSNQDKANSIYTVKNDDSYNTILYNIMNDNVSYKKEASNSIPIYVYESDADFPKGMEIDVSRLPEIVDMSLEDIFTYAMQHPFEKTDTISRELARRSCINSYIENSSIDDVINTRKISVEIALENRFYTCKRVNVLKSSIHNNLVERFFNNNELPIDSYLPTKSLKDMANYLSYYPDDVEMQTFYLFSKSYNRVFSDDMDERLKGIIGLVIKDKRPRTFYGDFIYRFIWQGKTDGETIRTLKNSFDDISRFDESYDVINYVLTSGMLLPYSYRKLDLAQPATRGFAIASIWRLFGSPYSQTSTFLDVDSYSYYALAINWANKYKITTGKTATTFAPEDSVTRGQFVTFIWRAFGCPEPTIQQSPFIDVKMNNGKIPYYYKAVLWAYENGITAGYSKNTFRPELPLNRLQVSYFMNNIIEKYGRMNLMNIYHNDDKRQFRNY